MRTYCTGSGPALLLEATDYQTGYDYQAMQDLLSTNYTVCSYDRAGYGKSQGSIKPRTKN
jgi:hypothetical protein